MISDGIPSETLAADDDMLGPYYLWRLLIDAHVQGRATARPRSMPSSAYLRTRPGADMLWTSCGQGEGSPQPFYERYGFVADRRDQVGARSSCAWTCHKEAR